MDTNPQELAKLDVRARRVRTLIIVVMLVMIAAPFVAYLIVGRGAAPGQ